MQLSENFLEYFVGQNLYCWHFLKNWNVAQFNRAATWIRHSAHCSYLEIYISQEIRLCEGDFEDKFQTIQASIMNFLIWKFRSITLIFLQFFAGLVKSTAFCTLFQWIDIFKLQFDAKMWLKPFNHFEIAVTVCKKQWLWQSCKKQKENECNRSDFSDQKVHDTGLYTGLKFAFKITFTKPDFFVKCKCPNSYSVPLQPEFWSEFF